MAKTAGKAATKAVGKAVKKVSKQDKELFRIATFILFDALVFHEVVASKYHNIASLRKAKDTHASLQLFLEREWDKILQIDFEPIFSLAKEILGDLPTSPTSDNILQQLKDAALNAVASGILLRHDFMGRIYHKLLLRSTGHFYATYYTSIPAARLLAQLVFKTPNEAWPFRGKGQWTFDDLRGLKGFVILDPACGSGTLLSATYTTLKDIYVLSQPDEPDLEGLHRLAIEEVIHGWDVLDYAAHLTLTTLALHEQGAEFSRSQIYTVPVGVSPDGNSIHLGSLDALQPQYGFTGKGFAAAAQVKALKGGRETEIDPPSCDVVLMNPPFSRSANPNVKFGYSDKKEKLDAQLRKLTQDLEVSGVGHAGLGAYFVLLGDALIKEEGRIALVLPRSCLSGVSWKTIRDRIFERYQLEYVISNFDPGNPSEGIEPWNWSENTDLGEVLWVARRTEREARGETVFVNLWNKPANDVESLLLAQQVLRAVEAGNLTLGKHGTKPLTLGASEVGAVYSVPQQQLTVNWLSPCLFAHTDLNDLTRQWIAAPPYGAVPLESLLSRTGPDIAQVKGDFVQSKASTAYAVIWGHQGTMDTMALHPSFVGHGAAKRGVKSAKLFSDNAAHLLLAERPHLHTESLLITRTDRPVLATAFWELEPREVEYVPLLLLWFQATFGFVSYLAHSTSSMGDIFKLKKGQLAGIPVVDPNAIDLKAAAALYEKLKREPFWRHPLEFERAAAGQGPRKEIDDFFIRSLGLRLNLGPYYRLFAKDPVLTTVRL